MPIETKCQKCGRKFRVPEKFAGKRVKCPKCQGTIEIPAGAQAAAEQPAAPASTSPKAPRAQTTAKPAAQQWHVQTEDGDEYGPVSREELDAWAVEGRIDASCQLLCEGWDQWKWAEDVFPQLAESPAGTTPPVVPVQDDNPFAGIVDSAPPTVAATPGPPAVGVSAEPAAAAPTTPATAGGSPAGRRTLGGFLHPLLTYLSIAGFFCSGVAFYVGVRFLFLILKGLRLAWRQDADVPVEMYLRVLELIAVLGAIVLYGVASYFLLNYRNSLDGYLRRDQARELDRAKVLYKKFWLFMYIASGILAGLAVISILEDLYAWLTA